MGETMRECKCCSIRSMQGKICRTCGGILDELIGPDSAESSAKPQLHGAEASEPGAGTAPPPMECPPLPAGWSWFLWGDELRELRRLLELRGSALGGGCGPGVGPTVGIVSDTACAAFRRPYLPALRLQQADTACHRRGPEGRSCGSLVRRGAWPPGRPDLQEQCPRGVDGQHLRGVWPRRLVRQQLPGALQHYRRSRPGAH